MQIGLVQDFNWVIVTSMALINLVKFVPNFRKIFPLMKFSLLFKLFDRFYLSCILMLFSIMSMT